MENTRGREKQIAARAAQMMFQARKLAGLKQNLPASFSDALVYLMKSQGITKEALAERCKVEPITIQRLRNKYYEDLRLPLVVSLCIGLKLDTVVSNMLIQKAGLSFQSSFRDCTYQVLLANPPDDMDEVNELLRINGLKPFGKEN